MFPFPPGGKVRRLPWKRTPLLGHGGRPKSWFNSVLTEKRPPEREHHRHGNCVCSRAPPSDGTNASGHGQFLRDQSTEVCERFATLRTIPLETDLPGWSIRLRFSCCSQKPTSPYKTLGLLSSPPPTRARPGRASKNYAAVGFPAPTTQGTIAGESFLCKRAGRDQSHLGFPFAGGAPGGQNDILGGQRHRPCLAPPQKFTKKVWSGGEGIDQPAAKLARGPSAVSYAGESASQQLLRCGKPGLRPATREREGHRMVGLIGSGQNAERKRSGQLIALVPKPHSPHRISQSQRMNAGTGVSLRLARAVADSQLTFKQQFVTRATPPRFLIKDGHINVE